MCQGRGVDVASEAEPVTAQRRDAKRAAIHSAAIDQFAKAGVAGTSMANIAEAAGMSRPALYLYFSDKSDIFNSAFVALFEKRIDDALAALHEPGTRAEQLDGALQRFEGDLWQQLHASPHAEEIVNAKDDALSLTLAGVTSRLWEGLATYLGEVGDVENRAAWIELLRLSPRGFKSDQPSVQVYRLRLTALARSVAADIDQANA